MTRIAPTLCSLANSGILDAGRADVPRTLRFVHRHEVVQHAADGSVKNVAAYRLLMECSSIDVSSVGGETYTCRRMGWKPQGGPESRLPSLEGWTYRLDRAACDARTGLDGEGRAWGLPHERFEGLLDEAGRPVPLDPAYQVYSAFTYFHSFCGPHFASGEGAALKMVGDAVAVDLPEESPIHLGRVFLPASRFLHGDARLEWLGIGSVGGSACAVLRYSETGGRYLMRIRPLPLMRVKSVGATRLAAILHVDRGTGWTARSEASVVDIARTTMYGLAVDASTLITDVIIESVDEDRFLRELEFR